MCNIFESPMTLAVAKPPYHSPTCRPPPSRDTPHTHWTLLQRDLPIEHQRTYQPYSGPAHLFHTFSFLSGLDPPVTGPQSQRSASCSGRFPFAPYTPAAHHPLQHQTRLLQLAQHRLHHHSSSASDSSFLARFLRNLHPEFFNKPVLCLPLC